MMQSRFRRILSVILVSSAAYASAQQPPADPSAALLQQSEQQMRDGNLDLAQATLKKVLDAVPDSY